MCRFYKQAVIFREKSRLFSNTNVLNFIGSRKWYLVFGINQIWNFALLTIMVKGRDQKLSGYKVIGLHFFNWPIIMCSVSFLPWPNSP